MVHRTVMGRMRRMQERLLAIRVGTGAYALPKEVKRIHLRFAARMEGGHMGPRKFWREEMVRLKYHNPAVSMTIDRSAAASDSAIMSVHFAPEDARQTSNSATSAPAPVQSTSGDTPAGEHDATTRVETFDMKSRTNSDILQQLVQITKAQPIETSEEDIELGKSLEEQRARFKVDQERMAAVIAQIKREKQLLEQARGEVAPQAA